MINTPVTLTGKVTRHRVDWVEKWELAEAKVIKRRETQAKHQEPALYVADAHGQSNSGDVASS
jgi:hypothetical protein